MKDWLYTKDSYLVTGVTEDGLPFFEKKFLGWNHNDDFSDIEDLVIIKAVVKNNGSEMLVENIFYSEEAMSNIFLRMKSEELEQIVLNEVDLWLNGIN
jgi:hypothetical protein